VNFEELIAAQAAMVPDSASPEFLCDRSSDFVKTVIEETEEPQAVEQQLTWSQYESNKYDDEGNITGTYTQGCGRIG
jgi:hypothetical protein